MIRFSNVSKSYAVNKNLITALDDINLEIMPQEIFGIIGKSGAGKSTLLRCINGLEAIDYGCVKVLGKEIHQCSFHELNALRRRVGMIFQHFNLLSTMTVYENIIMPLRVSKTDVKASSEWKNALLSIAGIQKKINSYPAQLSGGEKQRVAIARALVNKPEILLCDEATSALDPETTEHILNLLRHIRDQFGIGIVLITHEMNVVRKICDSVAVMHNGKILENKAILEFLKMPSSFIGKRFLENAGDDHYKELIKERSENCVV